MSDKETSMFQIIKAVITFFFFLYKFLREPDLPWIPDVRHCVRGLQRASDVRQHRGGPLDRCALARGSPRHRVRSDSRARRPGDCGHQRCPGERPPGPGSPGRRSRPGPRRQLLAGRSHPLRPEHDVPGVRVARGHRDDEVLGKEELEDVNEGGAGR